MRIYFLLSFLLTYSCLSQLSAQNVGVNLPNTSPLPTANLDINGSLFVTELIENLTDFNYVNSAIPTRFDADRTVIVDANGYIGYEDGVPIISVDGRDPIRYTRDSAVLKDETGYINSITTIDSQFYVRITNVKRGIPRNDRFSKNIEIAFNDPTHFGVFVYVEGGPRRRGRRTEYRPPVGERNPVDPSNDSDNNDNLYASTGACLDPRTCTTWFKFPLYLAIQPDGKDVLYAYVIDYSKKVIYRIFVFSYRPDDDMSRYTEGSIFIEELK